VTVPIQGTVCRPNLNAKPPVGEPL